MKTITPTAKTPKHNHRQGSGMRVVRQIARSSFTYTSEAIDMGLVERPIPRGLTGLPVGSKRAAKLARKVADQLETPAALVPLVELLLGIAPLATSEEDMPDGLSLSGDLWDRYCSALTAVETLYSYSDEYAERIRKYMLRVRPKYDPVDGEHLTDDNQIKQERRE